MAEEAKPAAPIQSSAPAPAVSAAAAPEAAPVPAPPALPDWAQAVRAASPEGIVAVLGLPGGDGAADVPTFEIQPEHWFAVVATVKMQGFTAFTDLTAVDHPERSPRCDVVLHLRDLREGRLVRCRTRVGESDALASIEPLFAGAGWPEREVFDLFGVRFNGNADLRRLMLPDDWQGHPLRRDYPLIGPRALDPDGPYAV